MAFLPRRAMEHLYTAWQKAKVLYGSDHTFHISSTLSDFDIPLTPTLSQKEREQENTVYRNYYRR